MDRIILHLKVVDASNQIYLKSMNKELIQYLEELWSTQQVGSTGFNTIGRNTSERVIYRLFTYWKIDENRTSEMINIDLKFFEEKHHGFEDKITLTYDNL